MKSIADQLNRDGVVAPHDNGKGNKGARGWGHSTIRAMLRNERYVGRWTWNANKWVGHPVTGKRRMVPRPRSEHVVRDVAELAIIERDLWERARARIRTQTASRGRTPGGR